MIRRLAVVLTFACLAAPALAQSDPAPVADPPEASGEQILVIGQRPGPGLWKVSRGEHVLWLLGTYSPLQQKMEWRSHEVEAILGRTQQFLAPPNSQAKMGFFTKLSLIPSAIGLQKLPDGAQLKDVLAPEVYARWLVLKAKYLGDNNSIESLRPIFAAAELHEAALRSVGLGNDREVADAVNRMVKKNKIKVVTTTIDLPIDQPRQMIREFKKASLDDSACFEKTLERLENDLDSLKVRAAAWAKGDLAEIETLGFADRSKICGDVMRNSAVIKDNATFANLEQRMADAWLVTVDKALATNQVSFGTLPIRRLIEPNGVVAALEARGYTVVKPD